MLAAIGTAVFLIGRKTFLLPKSKTSLPQQVRVSNVQDNKFTVSWLTSEPVVGKLKYGTSSELDGEALDERDERTGESGKYKIHYVAIKNLEAEKKYYFQIGSNEAQSVTTGPVLKSNPETKIVSGRILKDQKLPAENVTVHLSAANIAPLSVLTDKAGRWTVFLNQARTNDLTAWGEFDLEATILKIEAQGEEQKTSAVILTKNVFPSVPDLVLGHAPYDFRLEIPPAEMVLEATGTATTSGMKTVTIDNPALDNEQINTQKPQFLGQGPPNLVITIKIESNLPYTTSVTVDGQGNWSFTPPFDLDPGEHSISASYTDADGQGKTINRSFVVLAAGESELPAITATPSAEAIPSASPSPSPSPSLVPQITIPATESGVPATGTSWPTILISFFGIGLLASGYFLDKALRLK